MPEFPDQSLITVAMPVYNAGKHLRPAVQSVLSQTVPNWELLIIDDGSTDSSLSTISDIIDPRIRLLRDGCNKGLAARLNEAIDTARGQFLARMDQDDISYPDRLRRQSSELLSDPGLDLVAVRAILISDDNRPVGQFPAPLTHAQICSRPWRGFYFPHPTWMGRIEWFRRYRYGSPQPYFSEDQELLLRSYRDSNFACIDEILFAYRVQGKVTLRKRAKTRWTVVRLQVKSFLGHKEYGFALLACAVFVLRMVMDAWTLVAQALGRRLIEASPSTLSESTAQQWERVRRAFG